VANDFSLRIFWFFGVSIINKIKNTATSENIWCCSGGGVFSIIASFELAITRYEITPTKWLSCRGDFQLFNYRRIAY